jgi:hypothetical protein
MQLLTTNQLRRVRAAMAKELSRRELYDLVWARPMTKVAVDLGISDVALHKICQKHRVPAPNRGYWAKVAAKKPVKQAAFRELSDGLLNRIRIEGARRAMPPEVMEARERAKNDLRNRQLRAPREHANEEETDPAVQRTKEKLEKAKCGADGFTRVSGSKLFAVSVSPACIARALSILDALTWEATARGHQIAEGEKAVGIDVDDEHMTIVVTEKIKKAPHESTEAESVKLATWQENYARRQRRGEWVSEWDKPRIPEWDYLPSGLLTLEIDGENHWDGLRRRFSDGKGQRLEGLVGHVLAALTTCAAARKAKRVEDERRQREWQEEEKRRIEVNRRNTLEAKRWEFFDRQIKLYEQARRIDAFVHEYVARHPETELPACCRALIQWGKEYAEAIRDVAAPECLVGTLEKYRLMDDETEIGSWVRLE